MDSFFQGATRVETKPTLAVQRPKQYSRKNRINRAENNYYKQRAKDSNPKALIPCYNLHERFRHKRWRLLHYSIYANLIQTSYYIGLGKYHKDKLPPKP